VNVSAVLVTRGNVDLGEIIEAIHEAGIHDCHVWDNSQHHADISVYGRYFGIQNTEPGNAIYVQDDDCLLEPAAIAELVAAYEPGTVVANMPAPFRHDFYADHCLVGFGAVFDRELPERAFTRFCDSGILTVENFADEARGFFFRCCDVVFTALTPFKLLDLPYTNMPWATGPDRMYRQPDHVGERARMLELARKARPQ